MGSDQLVAPGQASLEDRLKLEDPPEIGGVLMGVKDREQSFRSRKNYKDRKVESALERVKKVQNIAHRDSLLKLFLIITTVGFSLWSLIVMGKVAISFSDQEQNIISENFVDVVSRTVIAEIIALAGTFVVCVWKEPKN